jgi:hypothetical protein
MKSDALVSLAALICLLLCMNPSAGIAQDMTRTITTDSTMDGNDGSILRIIEYGEHDGDYFVFEEEGKYRIYAVRDDGPSWAYLPAGVYYCPVSSMTIGETWRAIDFGGQETLATVALQEQVTTTAGTFSCYRIDIHLVSNPGAIVQRLWISDGVGMVKEAYFETSGYWMSELTGYMGTGTGFFPGDAGNIWTYSSYFVGTTETSWGAIKSMGR